MAVLGDAICDRYVFCETADVANEAPVLTLKPRHEASYLGGAAMIAGHLRAMGAAVHLMTCVADDEPSRELIDTLHQTAVEYTALPVRASLPIKQRYLAANQKLFKIDRGEPHPLDSTTERKLVATAHSLCHGLDALVIVDFGYGTVTSSLLEMLLPLLRPHVATITADISGPRRTLLSMKYVDLLTPTERELRGVAGDFEQSLPTVAAQMMQRLSTPNLIATLGDRGAVMFHPRNSDSEKWFETRLRCEYLPALADRVRDVVGAGDAMLAAATLALAGGVGVQQAGYLGSIASAVAVDNLGNLPVGRAELHRVVSRRPELLGIEVGVIPSVTSKRNQLRCA